MKINRDFLIKTCFFSNIVLAGIGFSIFPEHKTGADIFLVFALIFILGFLSIAIYEIVNSSKLSKTEKILWPIGIILLSSIGQIIYLVSRKKYFDPIP